MRRYGDRNSARHCGDARVARAVVANETAPYGAILLAVEKYVCHHVRGYGSWRCLIASATSHLVTPLAVGLVDVCCVWIVATTAPSQAAVCTIVFGSLHQSRYVECCAWIEGALGRQVMRFAYWPESHLYLSLAIPDCP